MIEVFNDMIGQKFDSVVIENEALIFTNSEMMCEFSHMQECCERVWISDVCGDLGDLVGAEITVAELVSKEFGDNSIMLDAELWSFYRFQSTKGVVVVRWNGESNGYYSTDVSFSCKRF